MAHLAPDPDIFRHVRRDHGRGRAQRQSLEHRHRRANAEGAGDVTGCRDHAALAAADNDRFVGERRIVALLDRGVERVAVDVGQCERGQLAVTNEARGTAFTASRARKIQITEAIPAKASRTLQCWRGWCSGFEVRTHPTRHLLEIESYKQVTVSLTGTSNSPALEVHGTSRSHLGSFSAW